MVQCGSKCNIEFKMCRFAANNERDEIPITLTGQVLLDPSIIKLILIQCTP